MIIIVVIGILVIIAFATAVYMRRESYNGVPQGLKFLSLNNSHDDCRENEKCLPKKYNY